MKKFCKVCDNQISRDWIREHFKDEYSKYCSKECKEKDEITISKMSILFREKKLIILYLFQTIY